MSFDHFFGTQVNQLTISMGTLVVHGSIVLLHGQWMFKEKNKGNTKTSIYNALVTFL